MRVLIIAESALLAGLLETIVESGFVFVISTKDEGVLVWRSTASQTTSLIEAIAEVDFVIISHSDNEVLTWVRELACNKRIMVVFADCAVPDSAASITLLQAAWPMIAAAIQTTIKKET